MKRRMMLIILIALSALASGASWLAASEPIVENLEFVEADIRDVFRSLGLAGQYNVLLVKEVQGTVTIPFQQKILVKDAIGLIARTYGYDYRWLDERTVVIGKADSLKENFDDKEPPKIFNLRYATVDEIVEALKVVVDTNTKVAKNPTTHQVTVVGSRLELENAAEVIAAIDRQPAQVNVEMRLEEVNSDSMDDLGVELLDSNIEFDFSGGGAIIPYAYVETAVHALETQGKATMLEQPNIVCNGSTPGDFFYGSSEPVGYRFVDEEGTEKWDIQFIEIGTKLVVEARVNEEDIVTVKVTAEVSSSSGTRNIGGSEYPVIEKRVTQSIARLRNGQTLVIAGLTRKTSSDNRKGLPLLSRIPIFGLLFGTKETKSLSKTLCIFLTPYIEKPALTAEETADAGERGALAQLAVEPVPEEESVSFDPGLDQTGSVETVDGTDEGSPADELENSSTEGVPPVEELATTVPQPALEQPFPETDQRIPEQPVLPRPEDIKHLPYTVKKGDTLAAIGCKFGVPWQAIGTYSKLGPKPVIRPGQVILVPIPESHKYMVKPGETLWRIAKRYGLTVELLVEINSIADPTKIEINQVVVLPCGVHEIVNKQY